MNGNNSSTNSTSVQQKHNDVQKQNLQPQNQNQHQSHSSKHSENNATVHDQQQIKPSSLLENVDIGSKQLGKPSTYEDEVAAEFPSPPVPTAGVHATANLTRNQFINTGAAVRTANIHKTRRNSNNNGQPSLESSNNNYKT